MSVTKEIDSHLCEIDRHLDRVRKHMKEVDRLSHSEEEEGRDSSICRASYVRSIAGNNDAFLRLWNEVIDRL